MTGRGGRSGELDTQDRRAGEPQLLLRHIRREVSTRPCSHSADSVAWFDCFGMKRKAYLAIELPEGRF